MFRAISEQVFEGYSFVRFPFDIAVEGSAGEEHAGGARGVEGEVFHEYAVDDLSLMFECPALDADFVVYVSGYVCREF